MLALSQDGIQRSSISYHDDKGNCNPAQGSTGYSEANISTSSCCDESPEDNHDEPFIASPENEDHGTFPATPKRLNNEEN